MTAIVINYNWLWLLISSGVALIFAPPLWWLAYEMHVQNKANKGFRDWLNSEDGDGEKGERALDDELV